VTRLAAAAALLILAAPGSAAERFAVIAVGDPPNGPDGDLAELAYQLRAACRDRVPNVEDPSSMRARLLGQTSNATESELDRAYGGALAVFQNGEFESALRTLRAIVEDLESLPDTDEAYFQWKRALLRLAHSAVAANDMKEAENAFGKLARVEPNLMPDPDQFSPGFRKRFEEAKARVRALPRRKLTITAVGVQGNVFVNGKPMGMTPVTVTLPTGTYRIGGGAASLRVPSFRADLDQEDRTVVLDFALAASLRMNAGPGLALGLADRAYGVIRAGAWLGVDKLIVVSRSEEGQAQFLVGSIHDVLRGALLREGSVRMVAGGVPSVNLAALAAFLLTGQSSREVKDLSRDTPRRTLPPVASAEAERGASSVATTTVPAPAGGQPPGTAAAQPSPAARQAATVDAASATRSPAAAAMAARPQSPEATRNSAPQPSPPTSVAAAADAPKDPPAAAKPQLDVRPIVQHAESASPLLPVADGDQAPRPAGSGKRWMGPAAIGAGVLAAGLAGFAVQQNNAASKAYSEAKDQLRNDGSFKSAEAQARWNSLRSEGARERRNAAISAGAAVTFTVTACILGWNAWRSRPDQVAALTIVF
jgi:hypothetical protein